MATLVLTAVGTALGGPIGGAVGAIVGQAADQSIFAPRARRGPRLGDLSVQTSSYGTQIPRIFGRMRVAGTVIWATDLIETRATSGGGKGRPAAVGYSYSANFAVALSARRLRAVHRIWAEGRLIRGAAGDFKTRTQFRLHFGDEDQAPDPLIASAESAALAPAYRGTAYAVFEDFALEEFGNRIPSLTFEVEADEEAIAIAVVAEELSDGLIVAGPSPDVTGYAASGDSVRSAIEALSEAATMGLSDDGATLVLSQPPEASLELAAEHLSGPPEVMRRGGESMVGEVSLTYYDPDRDYQAGTQRAASGLAQRRAERRSVAAALPAASAKGMAEAMLAASNAARASATLSTSWTQVQARPGTTVRIGGQSGAWRVDRWRLGPITVALELSRLPSGTGGAEAASSGRTVTQLDAVLGPTVLRLLDVALPTPGDGLWLFAAAAGIEPGWRRGALSISLDDGASWSDLGATAAPAVLGRSLGPLPAAPCSVIDCRSVIEVELLNDAMWLENCNDDALAAGANLALIGSELVQFGVAEAIGERRFRLRRLLRGRRGTERAAGDHGADDPFTLLRPDALVPISLPASTAGSVARLLATGIGDGADGAAAQCAVTGETLRPPSPAHLSASFDLAGNLAVSWVRRSRLGWAWTSAGDTPLGEERERYLLTLNGEAASRTIEVEAPGQVFTSAELAAAGLTAPLAISVTQIGTHLMSRAAELALP